MITTCRLAVVMSALALAWSAGLLSAQTAATQPALTAEQKTAIQKGLAWLAKAQLDTGGYKADTADDVAITAFAGLAFLSAGVTPGQGEYGGNLQKVLDYVLGKQQESGFLASKEAPAGAMYDHGFGTLFLAEALALRPAIRGEDPLRDKLGAALAKAVQLIEGAQNKEGGWRYHPKPVDADISVTICQLMALRAARDAGIDVQPTAIEAAVKYVKSCQNKDGGFNYMPTSPGSGLPRSAAAVAILHHLGFGDAPGTKAGLAYVQQNLNNPDPKMAEGFFFYARYYAAQTLALPGPENAKSYAQVSAALLKRQDPGGSWKGEVSDHYATALAVIILEIPEARLPAFRSPATEPKR